MATYVISDLHLSFGVNKPMNVFGEKWNDYENRISTDWKNQVKEDDYVIIAGDISWATYLEEALNDFKWIDSLPGKKIILKGNHDYWWETVTKMNNYLHNNGINSIEFLYNNFIETGEYLVCGTRYWAAEEGMDNEKIINRELERAKLSLNSAIKYKEESNCRKPIIMCTHYPPDEYILDQLKDYDISLWIYAHIHSNYEIHIANTGNIPSKLTSCDYLDFKLLKL